MSYEHLAGFYDRLNRSINYEKWADDVSALLAKKGITRGREIFDAACGTGRMTLALAHRGYCMTGIDLSPEMLSLAKKASDDEGLGILFVCEDISALSLGKVYDAGVCCLDSLNYVTRDGGLDGFFSRAAAHISGGGLLFFDVNSEYKFSKIYANNSYVYDEDEVFCVWQNYYSARRKLCDFDLTFFVKNPDGSYRRESESQRERYYPDEEILSLLDKNGFDLLYLRGDHDFSGEPGISVLPEDERHYFVAVRRD